MDRHLKRVIVGIFTLKMGKGGGAIGISEHFVMAELGLNLIFHQSVIVFTKYDQSEIRYSCAGLIKIRSLRLLFEKFLSPNKNRVNLVNFRAKVKFYNKYWSTFQAGSTIRPPE